MGVGLKKKGNRQLELCINGFLAVVDSKTLKDLLKTPKVPKIKPRVYNKVCKGQYCIPKPKLTINDLPIWDGRKIMRPEVDEYGGWRKY